MKQYSENEQFIAPCFFICNMIIFYIWFKFVLEQIGQVFRIQSFEYWLILSFVLVLLFLRDIILREIKWINSIHYSVHRTFIELIFFHIIFMVSYHISSCFVIILLCNNFFGEFCTTYVRKFEIFNCMFCANEVLGGHLDLKSGNSLPIYFKQDKFKLHFKIHTLVN